MNPNFKTGESVLLLHKKDRKKQDHSVWDTNEDEEFKEAIIICMPGDRDYDQGTWVDADQGMIVQSTTTGAHIWTWQSNFRRKTTKTMSALEKLSKKTHDES